MSDKRSDIMKIWRECFPADSPEWVEMYFGREYDPECALTAANDQGLTVSSMLLQPYTMTFHGQDVRISYISGAATMPRYRGQGLMTRLVNEAIVTSHNRGDMLCTLIPASRRLRLYYARMGFASVFYNRLHRYTSAHTFPCDTIYDDASAYDQASLYTAYRDLAAMRPCAVRHTPRQFATIMADNTMSGGVFKAVADCGSKQIAAMAWAIPQEGSSTIRIIDILSADPEARRAVLRLLREHYPDRPITIADTPPDDSSLELTKQGMARVSCAGLALEIIARTNPSLKAAIRVSDPVIADNNAIFTLNGDGSVGRMPHDSRHDHLDFDIDISVLCRLIFSSAKTGEITGIPSQRPVMTLMLD